MAKRRYLACILAACAVLASGAARGAKRKRNEEEVYLSNEEFKKLDRFEAHSLDKADKVFNEGKFRQAGAEYETFLREHSRSLAIPYVLLRKARCLHLNDKRHEAIREYNEVLDYFPNAVRYAGAALYYQGWAHWDNGDEAKAMKHWARMAKDADYRKHPLAAVAINQLAENLARQGHVESAISYFWQVAVDFRKDNRKATADARHRVEAHYYRANPSEPKLRQLYKECYYIGTPTTPDETIVKSFAYWDKLRQKVRQYARFTKDQDELKKRFYAYWAAQLDGKFPKQDDYQLDAAAFHLAADGDVGAWIGRVDAQFARNAKPGDFGRLVKWIGILAGHKAKMMEYYNRLDFSKMTNAQIVELMKVLWDRARNAQMARNAFGRLRPGKMSDGEKASLARYLWERDFDLGRDLCMSMTDKDRGKHELLLYYHHKRDAGKGIPLADHLIGVPEYATSALWKKAELLEVQKKHAEAILVYRRIPDQPANLWRIASCYERMRKVDQAVKQLKEIEAFFKQYSARAALRIAYVYRRAGIDKKGVAAFRRVLIKYPDTSESSDAHHQLERMGVTRIKGGVRDGKEDE